MHQCHGDTFPIRPSGCFPARVHEPGAFPSETYDLAFWGFPCLKYSTLHRHVDPQGVSRALEVFDTALTRLRENLPRVFVLENTASLLALPETLAHIDASLSTLPYDWRCIVTPPAPLAFTPCVTPATPQPAIHVWRRSHRVTTATPHRPQFAPRTKRSARIQVHRGVPPCRFRSRHHSTPSVVGGIPPSRLAAHGEQHPRE